MLCFFKIFNSSRQNELIFDGIVLLKVLYLQTGAQKVDSRQLLIGGRGVKNLGNFIGCYTL